MRRPDRPIAVAAALAFLVAACAARTQTSGSPTVPVSATGSRGPASISPRPLEGQWDTGPYPARQVRAAIIAAGYTQSDADEVLGGKKRIEFNFTFGDENGVPFVIATGWDPSKGGKPSDGDRGPYRVLPNNRLAIGCPTCDIDIQYDLFSYDLEANTLTLRFIRAVDPKHSQELRGDAPYLVSWTAAPLHKIG